MNQLSDIDIKVSLVAFLYPNILRDDPRTETNAQWMDTNYDYSVQDGHYFLLLMKFDQARWLATPLFSDTQNGRRPLVETKKGGFAEKWKGIESYYYPWQHWLVPTSAIIDASADEESPSRQRRSYASGEKAVIRNIASLIIDNLTPFHKPRPKPKDSN